jgi:hypothetical protein
MNLSYALRKGVDQDKSFREAVRRARVLLLFSEAGGTVTGDDAMDWITAAVLAVMVLASVTVHAMTGGSVAVGFRREIPFRSVKAKIARTPRT